MRTAEFYEGKQAYSEDLNPVDNPYGEGTELAADWHRGWTDAKKNDPLADLFGEEE